MLWSEYMVAEQAKLYAQAQGLYGPRYWALDRLRLPPRHQGRAARLRGRLRGLFSRYFHTTKRGQIAVALQMGDERVIAHMD